MDEKRFDQHQQETKTPKLSIRRKVSIHFKGKKERAKKMGGDNTPESPKPRTPGEKRGSIFDIRFSDKDKEKARLSYQKTSSIESRMSTTETSNAEPKTPTSTDSRTSNEKKNVRREDSTCEKKNRKSVSVSPDRNKHVHLKDEGIPTISLTAVVIFTQMYRFQEGKSIRNTRSRIRVGCAGRASSSSRGTSARGRFPSARTAPTSWNTAWGWVWAWGRATSTTTTPIGNGLTA